MIYQLTTSGWSQTQQFTKKYLMYVGYRDLKVKNLSK